MHIYIWSCVEVLKVSLSQWRWLSVQLEGDMVKVNDKSCLALAITSWQLEYPNENMVPSTFIKTIEKYLNIYD